MEIDLLRRGLRVIEFTSDQLDAIDPFDYLITVNRFQPGRTQHEIIPKQIRNRLPNFGIPLMSPDPDVPLDLQAALDRVYQDGSYMLRIHYERPYVPELSAGNQAWVWECWTTYTNQHPELFGSK